MVTTSLTDLAWPRRTARLTIRPATPTDAATTWEIRRLPEVSEWMTVAPATVEEYAARFTEEGRLAKTLVMELHDGTLVGDLMVSVEDAWAQAEVSDRARGTQAELGWVLDPVRQGRGLATEAVQELLRLCFDDLGLRRVLAQCFADYLASWRLMERVGMRRETHTLRESLHRSRGWVDGMAYALLAEEWRNSLPAEDSPTDVR